MLQGLYAAASGMEAQQNQFDAISNDLANLNTPGYQAAQVGFQDLLYSGAGSASGTTIATGTGAASSIVGRSQAQGALQSTGNPLDVAINGPGYLQVRRSDGTVGLTRNGSLQVDAQGQITDQSGDPLVPPVTVPKGVNTTDLRIAANGTVTTGTRTLGRIAIVDVPAPSQLQPDGTSLFSVTAGSGATRPATGSTLQQGALEGSNVDMGQAMSDMIGAERNYQMSSQAINYQDQMLQIADQIKK
ncbi:MAG TPA: flagellar hook-basal body protein [Solirubrobacteraceae bacterium]|jgi:flagellar basal-body rod protein FlgG|nr:flagellar hook-basal body protein [Solirubrobacteraceae bacterium]